MKEKSGCGAKEDYDAEPVFRLLVSYFDGDRERAISEVRALVETGRSVKDACEVVIASHGFENSFY
jgi:hypothetical protein